MKAIQPPLKFVKFPDNPSKQGIYSQNEPRRRARRFARLSAPNIEFVRKTETDFRSPHGRNLRILQGYLGRCREGAKGSGLAGGAVRPMRKCLRFAEQGQGASGL